MLAQIAEEIRTPDRAAQGTGEGGNSDYHSQRTHTPHAHSTSAPRPTPIKIDARPTIDIRYGRTRRLREPDHCARAVDEPTINVNVCHQHDTRLLPQLQSEHSSLPS
jgi:hypothetical protein